MTRYFVGLGANLDDRLAHLRRAATQLAALDGVEQLRASGIWETRPLGPGKGPFLNAAVELRASLEAPALLDHLLELERSHGRVRRERWGDRILDLDLLCAFVDGAELIVDSPPLTLPHPGLAWRDFVLQPLVDLDATLVVAGRSCAALLAALPDEQRTLISCLEASLIEPDAGARASSARD